MNSWGVAQQSWIYHIGHMAHNFCLTYVKSGIGRGEILVSANSKSITYMLPDATLPIAKVRSAV
jgi:hypothetical protein